MKVITRQSQANGAAARWKKQYGDGPYDCKGGVNILRELEALGSDPNPDDVDRVTGNTSWTRTGGCCECGKKDLDVCLEIGEPKDYNSRTTWLCIDCVKEALELMEQKEK